MSSHLQSYGQRAQNFTNPAAKLLLETMERKKSNLAVSVDVTKTKDFLSIIDTVGPFVCLIKTHIDILEDFDPSLITQLKELSQKHNFLIFEDRKFADIGNTVALQYSRGVHRIADWAHITNAHAVPGPGIITGLSSVGLPLGRGLLLLAEMSTKGSLATGAYTDATLRMAENNRDFVVGFVAQQRMGGHHEDFLVLTPGVGLDSKGDGMGQQYRTPREVILDSACDVIIVGRGIYGGDTAESVRAQAQRYQDAGWSSYLERISLP
ncbi:Orotidine 5'-phosphate decarboxylase [Pluteus cervinus]|uniref:Orotidine 5'-phosphate decarboxylase n=1 Tax=Pluteus cervinus TaxID=181527 RepID=A0ACD3BDT6_9AGAR|nr:Orotidine 5'-phosphate decarboxylase [Pluteus cervinus]